MKPDYSEYLASLPLLDAVWWFVENVSEEDTRRTDYFFSLRQRMREQADDQAQEPVAAPEPLAGIMLCCPECMAPVGRDSNARWDPAVGEWVHNDVYDNMWCMSGCTMGGEFDEAIELPLAAWIEAYPHHAEEYGYAPATTKDET